jgi:glycosyltransferase involved in cell wall biosynthesis
MALRILIIADGLLSGGAERQIIELLQGLKQHADFNTSLCVLSEGGVRASEGVNLADSVVPVSVACNAGGDLLRKFPMIALQAVRGCRTSPPDIIHSYGCFADILGVILSRIFKVPFINGSVRAARPRLYHRDRLSQLTFPWAHTIVANSCAGLRSFGIKKKGVVIHNGVQLARFEKISQAKITGSPVLCMVGNFTDKKDQKRLISCLPRLQHQYPEIRLILVGRGKHVDLCKELCVQLGSSDNVLFIEDCDNPEPYISRADVCLLISNITVHGEGISNAIIEYMAMEKPVIASDCGGNGELIADGVTGILIPENDRVRLGDAIIDLLADAEKCRRMSRAGRSRIENEFSIDRMVNAYVQLYRDTAALS